MRGTTKLTRFFVTFVIGLLSCLSACAHGPAALNRMDSDQIQRVSDWRVCDAQGVFFGQGRQSAVVDAEVERRSLDCSSLIAASVSDCSNLTISATRSSINPEGFVFTVVNVGEVEKYFRIYYQGVQSSRLNLPPGQTREFGVASDAATRAIGARIFGGDGSEARLNECLNPTPSPFQAVPRRAAAVGSGVPIESSDTTDTSISMAVGNVNLRVGAGTGHRVIRTLRPGDRVRVIRIDGDWCECVTSGSERGFVSCRYLSEPVGGWDALRTEGMAHRQVGWDAQIVFDAQDESAFVIQNASSAASFARTMRRQGASPSALNFSAALGSDSYAISFREFGGVDLVETRQPQNESNAIFLVNGSPDLIRADAYELSAMDRRIPAIRAIIARQPDADVWPYGEFQRHQLESDGRQKFYFVAPMMACRACQPIIMIQYVVEFDSGGRNLGASMIGTSPAMR